MFFQVVIKSIRAGRRLTLRALLGPSTKIDFEVILPVGRSKQDVDNAVTVLTSYDLVYHIVNAVARDDGMKAGLAAEGLTLADLAALELTVEASAAPAPAPAEAEISEGVSAVVYAGVGGGVAALVGVLVTIGRFWAPF